jgi:DNA-directed RNA polymerase subunit RPC12/RpoP
MVAIDLFRQYWFVKVILSLWLISSIFVLLLLSRIDSIVNVTLYTYGLHSSVNWLDPYWISLRLIYIFLAVPIAFSAVVLIAGFAKASDGANKVYRRVNSKLSTNQAQDARENSMLIRCTRCGKVFNKPLTMLDFTNGKPRLANVCPYCNHILGSTDDKGSKERIKAEFEKEVPTE